MVVFPKFRSIVKQVRPHIVAVPRGRVPVASFTLWSLRRSELEALVRRRLIYVVLVVLVALAVDHLAR